LKPEGIRVTTLCAGSIDTPFFDTFRPSTERALMLRVEDAVKALMMVLTSPPNVLYGEIVLRPRT
jgi:short-subunit dehydrogenase